MKQEIVFKCQFCGHRYQIVCIPNPKKEDDAIFATFKDRRRLDAFTWSTFEGAICSVLIEHPEFERDKLVEMWS